MLPLWFVALTEQDTSLLGGRPFFINKPGQMLLLSAIFSKSCGELDQIRFILVAKSTNLEH